MLVLKDESLGSSFKSKKQTLVYLFNTEVGYRTLTQATKEAMWIKFLFS
jgi:hypothetical protein